MQKVYQYTSHGQSKPAIAKRVNIHLQRCFIEALERMEGLLWQISPIAENCARLKVEQQAMEAKIKEMRVKSAKTNEVSNNSTQLLETLYQLLASMKRTIDELKVKSEKRLNLISANGAYIDKVDIALLIDNGEAIRSEMILTSMSGYAMELIYEIDIDGQKQKPYLSVSLVLLVGDFDAILPWPLTYGMTLSILDLSAAKNHIEHSIPIENRTNNFNRPVTSANSPYKIGKVSMETLHDKQNQYIQDGLLFAQLQIDFTSPIKTSSPDRQISKQLGNPSLIGIQDGKA